MASANLTRFAWLSICAAILTIALKTTAYWLTGSVGLLSDAVESLVNLVAAIMALAMLTIAARPADEMHAFGHGKAEYFSSGLEELLILLAAAGIVSDGRSAPLRAANARTYRNRSSDLGSSIGYQFCGRSGFDECPAKNTAPLRLKLMRTIS